MAKFTPVPSTGRGCRSRSPFTLIAASITVYKWLRSGRYRVVFARMVLAMSNPFIHHWHQHQVPGAQGCFDRSRIHPWCLPLCLKVTGVTWPRGGWRLGRVQVASSHPALLNGVLWELGAGKELRQQQQQHHSGSSLSFQAIVPPSVFQRLFCLCSHLLCTYHSSGSCLFIFSNGIRLQVAEQLK